MKILLLALGIALVSPLALAAPRQQADEPQSQCVATNMIRSTKALDDKTIIFTMRNGEKWKNSLPMTCPRLKYHDAFSYKLTGTRLCDIDVITVLEYPLGGSLTGPTCQLGKFEKYIAPAPAAKT